MYYRRILIHRNFVFVHIKYGNIVLKVNLVVYLQEIWSDNCAIRDGFQDIILSRNYA